MRPALFSHCSPLAGWLATSLLLVATLGFWGSQTLPAAAQTGADTTQADVIEQRGLPANHNPDGALRRALAIPGWGQLYNRQYWKMPLVYAGLGGVIALVVHFNDQYFLYRRAALYVQDDEEFGQYRDQFETVIDRLGADETFQDGQLLREQRDNFRRNRDLSILGVGAFYAFTVLDAYVSAHLMTFDVGEDLTIEVQPAIDGVSTTVRF